MNNDSIKKLLESARAKKYRIVCAESLTAGLISAHLAEVPGASDVLLAGFVVYTPEAKSALLDISSDLITRYGVVSEEVARAMATGALIRAAEIVKSEKLLSVAVSGIAGPDGATETQPLGTVCLAVSRYFKEKVIYAESETFLFQGTRNEVREQTAAAAVEKLNKTLNKI